MQQFREQRILPIKLRPPQSPLQPLLRPRLIDSLAAAGTYRLGLVCAPAGCGKTTTLAQLYLRLAQQGVGVGWLSVDEYDNEPHRFLAGLIAACQTMDPQLGAEAAALMAVPDTAPRDVAAALADALLGSPREFVIIIDDYHEIESPEVHASIEFLLRYLPGHVSLVLGTRNVPPLSLARLRLRGWLREVYWDDLRFTVEESAEYLREAQQLPLTDAQVAALNERAEGWITGLQLAAMSLQSGADTESFVKAFSGAQADVADYLMQDVFQRQPPEVQNFLLKTSILDRLSAGLCDAVVGCSGSQTMLERLDESNLFLFRLDATRSWYRYHHLFADFLRTRLAAQDAGAASQLARRANQWFESQQMSFEALSYAVRGGLMEDAAQLLQRIGREMFYRGEFKELRYWLDQLPPQVLRQHPDLCLLRAWAQAYLAELAGARESLLWAGAAGGDGKASAAARIGAEVTVLRVAIGIIQADEPQVADVNERLPERFPPADTILRAMAHVMVGYTLRAEHRPERALAHVAEAVGLSDHGATPLVNLLARFNQGALLHLMGRADAAEKLLSDSIALATQRRWSRSMGMAFLRVQRAVALQEQYRVEEALAELNAAIDLLEATQAYGFLGVAYTERARIHLGRGASAELQSDLARAAAIAQNYGVTRVELRIALLRAREALTQNRILPAHAALRPHMGLLQHGVGRFSEKQETLLLTYLRVLLAEQRHAEALEWARQAVTSAEQVGRGRNHCEFLLLASEAYRGLGQREAANQAAEQALALGEAGGLVAPFLLLGRERLERLEQLGHTYAGRLANILTAPVKPAGDGLLEPLHPREMQILRLIAQGMRNKEIGQRLFISEETVKWYLKKLFRKLDVTTRTQAIRWAQDHDVLS